MNRFIVFFLFLFFLSCNKQTDLVHDKTLDNFENKETFIFTYNLNNSKISEEVLVKMALDSINYSEGLNLYQNQSVDFGFQELKDKEIFTIETEKCILKFISNFSENDSYKVFRDKNSIGDFHFISIEGIDGITTLLINKKSSTYQLFDGELIFNEDKSKFLIMKNDVDYSVIKLFNFENNQIDNQRNYYSEMNFVQNITLIKDKIILKTKLPKSKPQVYEIMN
jgi:hypothetical protein